MLGASRKHAHEQNRILIVGSKAKAKVTTIGKVDTGEAAGGNPTHVLELSVVPEGGSASEVQLKQIIPSTMLCSSGDGTATNAAKRGSGTGR